MHNRFDQLVKRLARRGLTPIGRVETEVEVSPDSMRIDVWFWPHAGRGRPALAPLGLLGRMARRSCTLEPFHRTPTGDQVADCVVKHRLFCRELRRRKPPAPAPVQWIIASGRPAAALSGLRFVDSPLGKGVHEGPPLTRTMLIVVSELPRTRDTLLVRLMGAGPTLSHAIADLKRLPRDAPERRLALPILVRLRLEIPTNPAKQTKSDREFLMRTRDIERYLKHLEELEAKEELGEKSREKGREEGRKEGLAAAALAAYHARFGAAPPAALAAAVEGASDEAALRRWIEVVTTKSEQEIAAALRGAARAKPAARRTTVGRRSPGRHAAAR